MQCDLSVQNMIENYANWLKSEITTSQFGDYTELTLPYVDRFNDYLQIYAKRNEDETIELTDDGYIINNLITSGVPLRKGTPKRNALEQIARNFNVQIRGEDIVAGATPSNYPQKKHMLIQAMLLIDDLYALSPEKVKRIFSEDVATYFDANEIYYVPNFSVVGKTETQYTYDFVIQRTKNSPSRFCRAINHLNTNQRDLALFNWIDTQDKRQDDSKMIIIYNDENSVKDEVLRGFVNYGVKTVPFSERQRPEHIQLFAA